MNMKRIVVVLTTMLFSASAFAGGFFVPEQGTKAVGMANAFTAIADDVSANWYNPAGLAFQGTSVMLSGDVLLPKNTYDVGGQSYQAKKATFVIPQLYGNYALDGQPITIGIGINAPFGLSTDWTNSGAPFSKVTAGADSVTFSQIEAIQSNLNLSYRISEHFAVAAGAVYYNATKVHLDNALLEIKGDGDGFGGNAALIYKDGPFSLGVNYRSRVKIKINGLVTGLAPLGAPFAGMSGGASTSVTLPDIVMVGASWQATPSLLLTAQADWTNWKTFDAINLSFAPSLLNIVTGTSKSVPENYSATTTLRLGMEWAYSASNRVRLGYVYDPTPTSPLYVSPRLPGNDRQLFTAGWGMDVNPQMTVDLAYAYVLLKDRNLTTSVTPIYNGLYKSDVHILSAGLNYRF